MSVALQQVLVGVLVIACALFASWRLATVRLRLRALDALGGWPGLGRAGWLIQLRERTRAKELSPCGGCAQGTAAAPKASHSRHP